MRICLKSEKKKKNFTKMEVLKDIKEIVLKCVDFYCFLANVTCIAPSTI